MKLKRKWKKRLQGSITVLLVIILLPMMTLSALIVDTCRINMARAMVSSAGDLTMNAYLANYDTILKDVYGLFAVSQTKEQLADSLKHYFMDTLVSYGVTTEGEAGQYVENLIGDFNTLVSGTGEYTANGTSITNLMAMDVEESDITLQGAEGSALSNGGVMRKQIVEYMKYRAPVTLGLSFLDSLSAFKNVQQQSSVVTKQVQAQENSQEVTEVCKKAIDEIREYDEMIKGMQMGEGKYASSAVLGVSERDGTDIVPINDYNEQADKYDTEWQYNYHHINMLNMVFQANPQQAEGVRLWGQYTAAGDTTTTRFIVVSSDSAKVNNNVNAVSLTLTSTDYVEASTTDDAETRFNNYLNNNFNNNENEYLRKLREDYAETILGPYTGNSLYKSDFSEFTREDEAIERFIKYEHFLKADQQDVLNYNDVSISLEYIVALSKYFNRFNSLITTDISNKQTEVNSKQTQVNNKRTEANGYDGYINSSVNSINSRNSSRWNDVKRYSDQEDNDPYAFLWECGIYTLLNNVMNKSYSSSVSSATFKNCFSNILDYNSLYNNRNDDSYSYVFNGAVRYWNEYYSKSDTPSVSFIDYMGDYVDGAVSYTSNPLYIVLAELYWDHQDALTVEYYRPKSSQAWSEFNSLNSQLEQLNSQLTALQNRRKTANSKFRNALSLYESATLNYQQDLLTYGNYKTTAANQIGREAGYVAEQYKKIHDNITSIVEQLETIRYALSSAHGAVEDYNDMLDSWEAENNSYKANVGGDGFSSQNEESIATSRSEYDKNSLQTLRDLVQAWKDEYQSFLDSLEDNVHCKYGSLKIDQITTGEKAKEAITSTVQSSIPAIVTKADAENTFSQMYDTTPLADLEADPLYFLNPPLPLSFLLYLNSTYPESKDDVSVSMGNEEKSADDIESDFESTKSKVKNGSYAKPSNNNAKEEPLNESGGDKYSYKGRSLPAVDNKTVSDSKKLDVSEDDSKKLNASSGLSSLTGNISSMLSGIGDAMSTAVENVLILDYIMENFSYNTMVQDAIVSGEGISDYGTAIASVSGYNAKYTTTDKSSANYKYCSKTLSNIPICSANNYLYGAEIEYMLYGNSDASTNVTYAKASIFAIRFIFNCIFAFTDSEIRTTTMAAGLAVQAATLGIVPYQIVQIILQLALAAAESAVDLSMMEYGLDVAVVKSSSTWSLSVSGGIRMASELATSAVTQMAQKGIESVSSGLQGVVDAGADKIVEATGNLADDLGTAANSKAEELMNTVYAALESKLEAALNELIFFELDDVAETASAVQSAMHAEVDRVFTRLESDVHSAISSTLGGNPIGQSIQNTITRSVDDVISSVRSEVNNVIDSVPVDEVSDIKGTIQLAVTNELNSMKSTILNTVSTAIGDVKDSVKSAAEDAVRDVQQNIKDLIADKAGELSEEVTENIREKATEYTNDFIDNYLGDGGTIGSANPAGSTDSSVASMLKFGYKEYLMLFLYIALCVDSSSNTILARTANVIEKNVRYASTNEGASYKHAKGKDFKMSNAYTYVTINADAKLHMLFLNMDFFARLFETEDGQTDIEGDFTPAATIKYKGLAGY